MLNNPQQYCCNPAASYSFNAKHKQLSPQDVSVRPLVAPMFSRVRPTAAVGNSTGSPCQARVCPARFHVHHELQSKVTQLQQQPALTVTRATPEALTSSAQLLHEVADLAVFDSSGTFNPLTLILPISAALAGIAALKFYLYSQLEYITASMLTKYVPKGGGGATVLQLGGGTRELYYYPKDTKLVTNVGEKINKGEGLTRFLVAAAGCSAPSAFFQSHMLLHLCSLVIRPMCCPAT
eukprot:GHUV01022982.1.p1 GENE.GHUV01022982.1~~GHUV01022982.1.p1  ORF type:complete len:237 (+),score=40.12 GHUV01022982.1:867-1577(+)